MRGTREREVLVRMGGGGDARRGIKGSCLAWRVLICFHVSPWRQPRGRAQQEAGSANSARSAEASVGWAEVAADAAEPGFRGFQEEGVAGGGGREVSGTLELREVETEDSTQKPWIRWPGAQGYSHSSRSPGVKREAGGDEGAGERSLRRLTDSGGLAVRRLCLKRPI